MFTSYQQTLDYLYASLPIFQRVGSVAYKKDITNTIKLCEVLGNPHQKFKSIHIAGTNGKGSSSHMLASILQSAGYKTGLYTSPHLKEFTERIKINGSEIDRQYVVDFVNRVRPSIESIQPSFFEITVAMAFAYFAQQEVDIAVIEVGLGGRLDSTNIITPIASLITNISFDHKDILGDTLEKIAFEKAGIIKPNVPVVVSERQLDVERVFVQKASECKSPIHFGADNYLVTKGEKGFEVSRNNAPMFNNVSLPLKGIYQTKNLAGVLTMVDVLRSAGISLTTEQVVIGLERTVDQTGLKGRWQKLGDSPAVVCDTGHNAAGVQEVMKQLDREKFSTLHIVWGIVKDKEPDEVLALLPKHAHYYFCQAKIPRAMDAYELARRALSFGLKGEVIVDVNEAIRVAKKAAGTNDFIFIGGSTFVVAEIENL